jgi:hypothetical protein
LALSLAVLTGAAEAKQPAPPVNAHRKAPDLNPDIPSVMEPDINLETPHIITAIQDGNPPKRTADPGRAEQTTKDAVQMNAQYERIVIYPHSIFRGRHKKPNWAPTDPQVQSATAAKRGIYMTLSTRGVHLTPKRLKHYVYAATHHYPQVKWWSWGNEPNSHLELEPWKNRTLAQTYLASYDMAAGYIRQYIPGALVDAGEFNGWHMSNSVQDIKFFRQILKYGKLTTDGIAYHPYDFYRSPRDSRKVERMAAFIDRAYKKGRLATPQGGEPPLDLSEYAILVRSREVTRNNVKNPESPRRKYDSVRTAWLRQYTDIACTIKGVRLLNLYGVPPPPPGWQGPFWAEQYHQDGSRFGSSFVLPKLVQAHPECVMQAQQTADGASVPPPDPAEHPLVSSVPAHAPTKPYFEVRYSSEGHQFQRPSRATIDGTSRVLTKKVSSRIPKPTP